MATNAAPRTSEGSVKLTHPDRVYWPDAGVTKEGLADYYAEVWPLHGPLIVGRPLALVRCPDGIGGQSLLPEARLEGAQPQHPSWSSDPDGAREPLHQHSTTSTG